MKNNIITTTEQETQEIINLGKKIIESKFIIKNINNEVYTQAMLFPTTKENIHIWLRNIRQAFNAFEVTFNASKQNFIIRNPKITTIKNLEIPLE